MQKFSELKPCPYRYGIAKKGKVLFECRYAGETYDVEEVVEICNNFCPFYLVLGEIPMPEEVRCLYCGAKMIKGERVRYYLSKIVVGGEVRQLFLCPRCGARRYVKDD